MSENGWSSSLAASLPAIRTESATSCLIGCRASFDADQIVALTAFGGLMVATNLFNNALRVDLDEYLWSYRRRATAVEHRE